MVSALSTADDVKPVFLKDATAVNAEKPTYGSDITYKKHYANAPSNEAIVARIYVFSPKDGFMTDFHLVHLGSFAISGAGLIMAEATAVEPRGRINPADAGIWCDDHIPGIKRVVDFVHSQGSKIGIQLAHAGRKASGRVHCDSDAYPESGYWRRGPEFQWHEKHVVPRELSVSEIKELVKTYGVAAVRAAKAGVDTVELPLPTSNHRTDDYGGSLENRARFMLEVIKEVRNNFPAEKPIFHRLSASDCIEHLDGPSWEIEQTVQIVKWAKEAGVDVIHVSSGGNTLQQKVSYSFGYQVHYAERIRKEVPGLAVVAVGSITEGKQAQEVLELEKADLVAVGRGFLERPSSALDAARELGVEVSYAPQYTAVKGMAFLSEK
ncbi:protein disulfide-isomerase precursor [Dissophora ornata]|nr:protein disulfide-isomerase precursor [Dissophora ornata]